MKIWQKTIILALIPVVLNALGVVLMQGAVGRLSKALAQEQTSADSLRQLNHLYVSMVQAIGLFTGYVTAGDDDAKRLANAEEHFITVKRCYNKLRQMTPRDGYTMDRGLQKLDSVCINGLGQMIKKSQEFAALPEAEGRLVAIYQLRPLIRQASKINDIYTTLLDESDKHREGLVIEQKEIVQRIQLLVVACLLFNIAFSAVALYLFRRSMISRLQLVLNRSNALATLKEAGPAMSGEDEFAQIDKRISDAHGELAAAESFRSQVVAMVAHDMRSPLTSSMTSLEMLENNLFGELPDKAQQKLGLVCDSLRRLTMLIDEFLDLDKLRRQELELDITQFSLLAMVSDVVSGLEAMASLNSNKFEVDVPDMTVSADEPRMRQILTNLLSNAIKFSNSGDVINIVATSNEDSWTLCVIDRGKGLSEAAQKELFKAYSPSEVSSVAIKGSGLGLFVCRWFTEAHGGKLEARANEDKRGTTFSVCIPRSSS